MLVENILLSMPHRFSVLQSRASLWTLNYPLDEFLSWSRAALDILQGNSIISPFFPDFILGSAQTLQLCDPFLLSIMLPRWRRSRLRSGPFVRHRCIDPCPAVTREEFLCFWELTELNWATFVNPLLPESKCLKCFLSSLLSIRKERSSLFKVSWCSRSSWERLLGVSLEQAALRCPGGSLRL